MGFLHDYVSNDASPRCVQLTEPRKIFLHQGVHLDGFSFRDEWASKLHPWLDYWMAGPEKDPAKLMRQMIEASH